MVFPFGMRPPPPPAAVDNERYYALLGASKDASAEDLKRRHRALALRHHPDKGGDPEKFKEINEAYDVLKDADKRRVYDTYGEEALKQGGAGGGAASASPFDMADLFGDLFGGGARRTNKPRCSPGVVKELAVTLEELYTGTTKRVEMRRSNPCDACAGTGTKSRRERTCARCRGSGVQTMVRPLGPGMIQQMQQMCDACRGSGRGEAPKDDRCARQGCGGTGMVPEERVFEVSIDAGTPSDARVVLRGEAGRTAPELEPGNLVLLLRQRPHTVDAADQPDQPVLTDEGRGGKKRRSGFQRVNDADLVVEKRIGLVEALCGAELYVRHLDGRLLRIDTASFVVKPGTVLCIEGEGMPFAYPAGPQQQRRTTTTTGGKGNMYVVLHVEFPDALRLHDHHDDAVSSGTTGNNTVHIEDGTRDQEHDHHERDRDHEKEKKPSTIDVLRESMPSTVHHCRPSAQEFERASSSEFRPKNNMRVVPDLRRELVTRKRQLHGGYNNHNNHNSRNGGSEEEDDIVEEEDGLDEEEIDIGGSGPGPMPHMKCAQS